MADDYPPVTVTASAIAWQEFGDKKAKNNLKHSVKSENADLVLMAINYLIYTENKSSFVEVVKEVANTEGIAYRVEAACKDFMRSLVQRRSVSFQQPEL